MWTSLSNIKYYQNLLDRKIDLREKISSEEYNPEKICLTCLRDTNEPIALLQDFELGAMSINNNIDGRNLQLIDMFKEISGLKISEDNNLPLQICNNCMQNISAAYFFRQQTHKSYALLLKVADFFGDTNDFVEVLDVENSYEISILHGGNGEDVDFLEDYEDLDEEVSIEICQMEEEDCFAKSPQVFEEVEGNDIFEELRDETVESPHTLKEEESHHDQVIEKPEKTLYLAQSVQEFSENSKGDKVLKRKRKFASSECPECQLSFNSQLELVAHAYEKHPSSKIFCCYTCGSTFQNPASLKRHSKSHDASERTKICSFCGKAFTRSDDLKRHIRTHTNERPYKCNFEGCGKSFKQTSEIKEHMVVHNRDREFECEICGKLMYTRNGYYVHMKVHYGIKKHPCTNPNCDKAFVTSGELHSHVKHIHEKARPFECTLCGRRLSSKYALETHARAHKNKDSYLQKD